MGGNVTVLRTGAGNVVIDSMTFPMQGKLIRAKARKLTGEDTAILINTHYHLDHTHGNPGFTPDTRVISTRRTLSHLQFFDADFWDDEPQLKPKEVFDAELELKIGDKTLRLLSPGPGHTDGDLVVIIVEENTAVMGDLLFNRLYPNIDLEAGGSIRQWSATLDEILRQPFQQVIPGHGATTNRIGIQNFQRFLRQLAQIGHDAAAAGQSEDEVINSSALDTDKGFSEIRFAGLSLGLNRKFVLRRAWQEATGNFQLAN